MVLLYSRQAYEAIRAEIAKVGGACETGGVLIGYRLPFVSVVREVTASHSTGTRANIEFVLDGELHTKLAQTAISNYHITPKLLGIWHSHVAMSVEFSTQDRSANQMLAKKNTRIFSSIVTGKKEPEIRTWHITADGCEKVCRTIIP